MGASASREKFKESFEELIGQDVSPDDSEFWDELWKIPSSAEEVFELINPDAARSLRDKRFDNMATLFTQATAQLCQIVETPYSIYFDQALNCVRVLTRILPFLLERSEYDKDVEILFWGTGQSEEVKLQDGLVGKFIGGDESSIVDPSHSGDDESPEPLALLAIHAAMHMLFLPQFTCDFYEDEELDDGSTYSEDSYKNNTSSNHGNGEIKAEIALKRTRYVQDGIQLKPKPACILWAPGCGVKKLKQSENNRKFDKNRIEVLRLLLAACCDPLYSSAEEYNPLKSRFLAVATAADAPNAVVLFYSLLNTIFNYEPKAGLGNPFVSSTFSRVVSLSSQLLCVLLDCGIPGNPQKVKNEDEENVVAFEDASKAGFNIFRTAMARISSSKELTMIYDGFTRLLTNIHESGNTLTNDSKKGIQCFQEILILLWKFLDENPFFMPHILTKCDVTKLVTSLCYIMYQCRKDPTRIGLIHISTFLLLKLSGERSFGVSLNKQYDTRLPCDIPLFTGGHADLMAITFHKLIVNGSIKIVPLYPCFLTIICNVSPYWRKMSLVGAVKLVNLFELFSSPKFLFSFYKAYQLLSQLLEVFNNIIQYQYRDNQHLVYAIIRRKEIFVNLASLSLSTAEKMYERLQGEELAAMKKRDSSKNNYVISTQRFDPYGETMPGDSYEDTENKLSMAFRPNEAWLSEFKDRIPFETISRLLHHLVPVIDEVVAKEDGVVDEKVILRVLDEITMVGLLPVPHPIVIRKYQPNQFTSLWFTAYLWGVIYVNHQSLPIFDGKAIRLFHVSVQDDEIDSDNESFD